MFHIPISENLSPQVIWPRASRERMNKWSSRDLWPSDWSFRVANQMANCPYVESGTCVYQFLLLTRSSMVPFPRSSELASFFCSCKMSWGNVFCCGMSMGIAFHFYLVFPGIDDGRNVTINSLLIRKIEGHGLRVMLHIFPFLMPIVNHVLASWFLASLFPRLTNHLFDEEGDQTGFIHNIIIVEILAPILTH